MSDGTTTNISSQHNLTKKKKYSSDPLFFLNHQSYGTYNRKLACHIGLTAAVLLAELIEKRNFHLHELISDTKHGDGWFYHTIESVEERTGLSKHEQPTALKKLQEAGFVEVKSFGLPCKRHFKLNDDAILAFFGFARKVEDQEENEGRKPVSGKRETGEPENGNYHTGKRETAPYIYNTKEDTKEKQDIAPPSGGAKTPSSSNSSNEKKIVMAPNVEVTEAEHAKLVEKFGQPLTVEGYRELSEWKNSAKPSQVNKHSSDYYRLRKRVIPDMQEEKAKGNHQKIAKHRQGSKLVTPGDHEEDNFRRTRL